MTQATFELGERGRNEGIARAMDHANRVDPTWATRALDYVKRHATGYFSAEDIRRQAEARGLERPPSERAWGGVMANAKREGFIRPTGNFKPAEDPKSHRGPKRIWKALND